MPNILQNNPLYQNLSSMAGMPQLGIYSQTLGTHRASMNTGIVGSNASTNSPTTT